MLSAAPTETGLHRATPETISPKMNVWVRLEDRPLLNCTWFLKERISLVSTALQGLLSALFLLSGHALPELVDLPVHGQDVSIIGEAIQKGRVGYRIVGSRLRLKAKKKQSRVGGLLKRVCFRVVVLTILKQLRCQVRRLPNIIMISQ